MSTIWTLAALKETALDRPNPGREALRYRVLAVREFIERMGIKR